MMPTENCLMCGKPHAGKYVICGACIEEYNLTLEQIKEMGGLRQIESETESTSLDPNKKNTASNTKKVYAEDTSSYLANQKTTQSSNPHTNVQTDPYIHLITKLTNDINTIKSILVIYFTVTVIGIVIYILYILSYSK